MTGGVYIRVMDMSKHTQTAIGLGLGAVMFGVWISVHAWAMFIFRPTGLEWAIVPVIFALQCWLSVGMFIVAHDAMHGSLVPGQRRMNGVIGAIILFLYAGFGWRRLRDAHFDHHTHVGSARDPDFNADNPADFWPWYMQFLKRYFGWQSMAFVWSVVLAYFFLFVVPPENIALMYGFPAIASSLQLFYFGTYRPHRHEAEQFADGHNARSNSYGWLTSLLTCFHFGYHHEHHLWPAVPWWALPAKHRDYAEDEQFLGRRI